MDRRELPADSVSNLLKRRIDSCRVRGRAGIQPSIWVNTAQPPYYVRKCAGGTRKSAGKSLSARATFTGKSPARTFRSRVFWPGSWIGPGKSKDGGRPIARAEHWPGCQPKGTYLLALARHHDQDGASQSAYLFETEAVVPVDVQPATRAIMISTPSRLSMAKLLTASAPAHRR